MSDPNSFVNFSDYLGLNQGAGDAMRAKTTADYHGPNADSIQALSDQHYTEAGAAGEGQPGAEAQYERSGQGVQQGIATYGEFLQGMADPAKRQALMEKTYGPGAVSAFDAALTSNGGGQAGAKAQINQLQTTTGTQGMAADQRQQLYQNQTAAQNAENARGAAARQNAENAKEARAASMAKAEKYQVAEDARNGIAHNGATYDQNGGRNADLVGAETAANSAKWARNNVWKIGGNDAAGRSQRQTAINAANSDSTANYDSWGAELKNRDDTANAYQQQHGSFSITDPDSW